jgi:hypothetical protein
VEFAVAF